MSAASSCSTRRPQVWLLSPVYAPRSSRRTNGCALCTRARSPHRKEGNDLHAPQRLRVRLVGPGKKGSVSQAEYLSELLESVPEHTRNPTHA